MIDAAGTHPENKRVSGCRDSWYLRSMADRDTHRGAEADGMVTALCGAVFAPFLVFGGGSALPGQPPDPEQICPDCYRAGGAR